MRALTNSADTPFQEFYCEHCDYTRYFSREPITSSQYEDSEKYVDYYSSDPVLLWHHRSALNFIRRQFPQSHTLDFGCYDGFFTKALYDIGINAFGCDWNSKSIEAGKAKFNLHDRLFRNPSNTYDLITAFEVIEHFEDPTQFIAMASEHLRQGGYLILSCPNKNAIYRPTTDYPPHHLSRFSQKSLKTLLSQSGFEIELHLLESSSFQLLRNWLGDKLRKRDTFDTNNGTDHNKQRNKAFTILRKGADTFSSAASIVSRPIDAAMGALEIYYISQLVIACKK
jgi:2-polyprenyl-3-methyl-5-hydroxy-6-metoxy-1,4-benzoquinol methylase